jgi:aminopeptidase N
MATYLAMVSIGKYDVYHSTLRLRSGRRIPVWNFIDPTLGAQQAARDRIQPILAFSERQYGPYPFDSVGIVIQDLKVGYALETQTRPFFDGGADATTMVHELGHQWFGDSVTPRDWGDLWLNEGFATYAEARWDAAHGGPTIASAFRKVYDETPASDDLWRPAPADLKDPANLFSAPVYSRGALTLEALQQRIGDRRMTTLLRRWAAAHRGRSVSTADFVALAERVSGTNLGPFFHTWLYVPGKPTGF